MKSIKRIIFFAILSTFFLFVRTMFAQPQQAEVANLFQPVTEHTSSSDFSKIDDHVLRLKTKKNITEAELATLITQPAQTKIEIARAIFIWIANNIAYDTSYKITSKEDALKQGKGVCEAYSSLFKSLGELSDLEVVTVSGDTKQYFYKQPSDLDQGGHAWNIVKVDDDRWMIVDATWGAGYVRNRTFTRKLSVHWFDPKPEIFIFTHIPKEDKWQLLNKPVTRDDFLRMPPLSPELVTWGFNPQTTFAYFSHNSSTSFPDQFAIDLTWKINMLPVSNELHVGKSYQFDFLLPENDDIVIIINNKDWIHFQKDGDKFYTIFTPETKGQAILAVKQPDGKFGGIFKYEIKD